MGDAAGELDHLQAPLDVAFGIGDHLAVFRRKQLGQRVHIGFDEALEFEHHPRAALGIGGRPDRLSRQRRSDRAVEVRLAGQTNLSLHFPGIGVEHVAKAAGRGVERRTVHEIGDLTHDDFLGGSARR